MNDSSLVLTLMLMLMTILMLMMLLLTHSELMMILTLSWTIVIGPGVMQAGPAHAPVHETVTVVGHGDDVGPVIDVAAVAHHVDVIERVPPGADGAAQILELRRAGGGSDVAAVIDVASVVGVVAVGDDGGGPSGGLVM